MRGLLGRQRQPPPLPLFPAAKRSSAPASLLSARLRRFLPASRLLRVLLLLALLSLVAPVLFHLRLRRFHRMRERKCGWTASPPMVCAHGGDSTNAFPNSVGVGDRRGFSGFVLVFLTGGFSPIPFGAGADLLLSSLAFVGISWFRWTHFGWLWTRGLTVWRWMSRGPPTVYSLLCMTVRDLQKMSGNSTSRVGYWSTDEIKALSSRFQLSKGVRYEEVPKVEDVLAMISQSVRQVILDVKVGPPSFEKGLAEDLLSLLRRTDCKNCLVWAKSDNLGRHVLKLSKDVMVGYIVMVDKSTSRRTELVRIEGAKVAGIYHPLIHEKVMRIMHRHGRRVFAWTVDDSSSMKKMLYEHVDAIVTSNPSLLQQLMQEIRTECMEDGFALL